MLSIEFHDALATHTAGHSWGVWNEERVLDGLEPLPLPVVPSPIGPLLRDVEKAGLRRTALKPDTRLFRGYMVGRIVGLGERSLTIDRITSFTPFPAVAREHGPVTVCVRGPGVSGGGVSDMTMCEDAHYDSTIHCGDLYTEVCLMPGTYKLSCHGVDTDTADPVEMEGW